MQYQRLEIFSGTGRYPIPPDILRNFVTSKEQQATSNIMEKEWTLNGQKYNKTLIGLGQCESQSLTVITIKLIYNNI